MRDHQGQFQQRLDDGATAERQAREHVRERCAPRHRQQRRDRRAGDGHQQRIQHIAFGECLEHTDRTSAGDQRADGQHQCQDQQRCGQRGQCAQQDPRQRGRHCRVTGRAVPVTTRGFSSTSSPMRRMMRTLFESRSRVRSMVAPITSGPALSTAMA